MAGRAYINPIY